MVAKNDITGDSIQSRVGSKAYSENVERIFGEKPRKDNSEYFARLAAETKARIESFDERDIDPDHPDGE